MVKPPNGSRRVWRIESRAKVGYSTFHFARQVGTAKLRWAF
jgi:hypothetical protein